MIIHTVAYFKQVFETALSTINTKAFFFPPLLFWCPWSQHRSVVKFPVSVFIPCETHLVRLRRIRLSQEPRLCRARLPFKIRYEYFYSLQSKKMRKDWPWSGSPADLKQLPEMGVYSCFMFVQSQLMEDHQTFQLERSAYSPLMMCIYSCEVEINDSIINSSIC